MPQYCLRQMELEDMHRKKSKMAISVHDLSSYLHVEETWQQVELRFPENYAFLLRTSCLCMAIVIALGTIRMAFFFILKDMRNLMLYERHKAVE